MIETATAYEKAREELASLEARLARLLTEHPGPAKGLTKAGVRKMIARLHDDLGVYEGHLQVQNEPSS